MDNHVVEKYKPGILLVEDEDKLRESVAEYLKFKGFTLFTAATGEEGIEVFYKYNNKIDIVLLDIMLPGIDGHLVLDEIRSRSDIPVIMLTACVDESKQLKSFRYGADVYITKPFRPSVLKAQIDALLKRTCTALDEVNLGRLKIDKRQYKAYDAECELQMTPKEFELLSYFADNIDTVLTREQILDAVWGYGYEGGERAVDTIVKNVRAKITDTGCNIATIYGVGYRFEVTDEINS